MRFGSANFLVLLVLLVPMLIFFRIAWNNKMNLIKRFGNIDILKKLMQNVSFTKQKFKMFLLLLTIAILIITLARPQIGTKMEKLKRKGLDIIIALDTSDSMLAEDIKPNRIIKAKHEISGMIDQLDGDRIGIIPFAGSAFVQCPLTLDYGAAKIFVDQIDVGIIPVAGTAIEKAIKTALNAFVKGERKYKILILVTDGEDHVGDPVAAAKEAAEQGIRIFCIGVGSRSGVPIPQFDERGNRIGFKEDRNGNKVMTKLDEETLKKIALNTDGKYYNATSGQLELQKIYAEIEQMEEKELRSMMFTQYEDRYQYILIIAFLLLIAEFMLTDRRVVKNVE